MVLDCENDKHWNHINHMRLEKKLYTGLIIMHHYVNATWMMSY